MGRMGETGAWLAIASPSVATMAVVAMTCVVWPPARPAPGSATRVDMASWSGIAAVAAGRVAISGVAVACEAVTVMAASSGPDAADVGIVAIAWPPIDPMATTAKPVTVSHRMRPHGADERTRINRRKACGACRPVGHRELRAHEARISRKLRLIRSGAVGVLMIRPAR
ncbi:hypothetical protein GCM10023321_63840 [Pseudonocardia eucalypti]|uniref:Secreted protein n=1 Tax=Pseudonocardia eucalypti TaxID=648755 RepID=A0ABP9QXJ1_9PSEU